MKKLEVDDEDLKGHLFNFFPSLKKYPEKYLPLILEDPSNAPEHLTYLCPVCLRNFIYYVPTQLRWSETFSLDHFPPEDVGGKLSVLVCKPCNNIAGFAYESKFAQSIEKGCFSKKVSNSKILSSVTISGIRGWHKSNLSINAKGEFIFKLTTNQTKNLPELAAWEAQPNGDWLMNITLKDLDTSKFTKALIKTSYLYCFNHWGYNFVFSNSGSLMRQVLNAEMEYPVQIPSVWLDSNSQNSNFQNIPPGPIFIAEPKELQSIFINIPIFLEHLEYQCVLPVQIPNPTGTSVDEMQRINEFIINNKDVTIKMAPINFPHPAMNDSFMYTWECLLKQFE